MELFGARRIDFRRFDGTVLDTPILKDLQIRTVVDELLHGLLYGLIHLAVAFFDDDAFRSDAFDLAQHFQLSIGLRDGIARNRRIGIEHVGLAGDNVRGHIGLQDRKSVV